MSRIFCGQKGVTACSLPYRELFVPLVDARYQNNNLSVISTFAIFNTAIFVTKSKHKCVHFILLLVC